MGARAQRQESGGGAAQRQQELPPRHPDPPGVSLAFLARPPDGFFDDGAERLRVVFAVGARAELDRQPGILVHPPHDRPPLAGSYPRRSWLLTAAATCGRHLDAPVATVDGWNVR